MLARRSMLRLAAITPLAVLLMGKTKSSMALKGEPNGEWSQFEDGLSMQEWMNELMKGRKAVSGTFDIRKFREPIYFLTSPISWKPNLGQADYLEVVVPRGFVTDFASIPRMFWSLFRPDGDYAYAAVVHDYLYWEQKRDPAEADHIFKLAMGDFEVGKITKAIFYAAVRLVGDIAWEENKNLKAKGERRVLARFPQDPLITWKDWKQRPDVFM